MHFPSIIISNFEAIMTCIRFKSKDLTLTEILRRPLKIEAPLPKPSTGLFFYRLFSDRLRNY